MKSVCLHSKNKIGQSGVGILREKIENSLSGAHVLLKFDHFTSLLRREQQKNNIKM